jgi:aspartate/methionine/tyrosine aminotransferase
MSSPDGPWFSKIDTEWCRRHQFGKWGSVTGDTIPMSLGEMDFRPHPAIARAIQQAAEDSPSGYAPARGLPALREAIAALHRRQYAARTSFEQVTVTGGVKFAATAILSTLLGPGDELVVAGTPAYSHLLLGARLKRARIVPVPLRGPSWELDQDCLRSAITSRTRAVLVNNPHNPTGKVFSPEELQLIVKCTSDVGAWLISDEVFEHLTYDVVHTPMTSVDPQVGRRCVILSGFGKSFGISGYRIGHIIHPGRLVDIIERQARQYPFVTSTLPQVAALACTTVFDDWIPGLRRTLQQSLHRLHQALRETPGTTSRMPAGTFYIWLTSHDPAGDLHDHFVRTLGIIPWQGRHFFPECPEGVRLNAATSAEIIDVVIGRIRARSHA